MDIFDLPNSSYFDKTGVFQQPSEGALGKIFGGPGKTRIRASYGIYYTSVEDLNLFYEVADAPFGLYFQTPPPVLPEESFLQHSMEAHWDSDSPHDSDSRKSLKQEPQLRELFSDLRLTRLR